MSETEPWTFRFQCRAGDFQAIIALYTLELDTVDIERLHVTAKQHGLTLAEYCRVILRQCPAPVADPEMRQPVPNL